MFFLKDGKSKDIAAVEQGELNGVPVKKGDVFGRVYFFRADHLLLNVNASEVARCLASSALSPLKSLSTV